MERNVKKIFAYRVKEIRKNRGYSQEQFAELLGIGVSTLSKIECAKSYPTPETMNKIIEILDVEPYLLFVDIKSFNIEKAYERLLVKLKKIKNNEKVFKVVYDYIMHLNI